MTSIVQAKEIRQFDQSLAEKHSDLRFAGYGRRPDGKRSRSQLWLIRIAALLYAVSMNKFVFRDPLSTNTGLQGVIEVLGMTGAFVCVLMAASRTKWQHSRSMAYPCFTIFAFFSLASCFRSFSPSLSFAKGALLLVVLATGHVANQTGLGQEYIRSIYRSYTALLVIGLVTGLLLPNQYPLISVDEFDGRTRLSVFDTFSGTMGEDVALLLLAVPLLHERVGWLSKCFLLAMNVFAGGKTTTALLCILFIIRFLLGVRRGRSWRAFVVVVGLVGLATCVVILLPGSGHAFADSAASIYGTRVADEAVTLDGRLDLWKTSLDLLQNAQISGYGLDGVRDSMIRVASWSGSPHNGYLELALAGGVLGFVFFILGLSAVVRAVLRASPGVRPYALSLLTFVLISAVIGVTFSFPSYFGLLVLLWMSYEAMASTREAQFQLLADRNNRF
jgi:O-antigen ligase